jgi:hypothetical protein
MTSELQLARDPFFDPKIDGSTESASTHCAANIVSAKRTTPGTSVANRKGCMRPAWNIESLKPAHDAFQRAPKRESKSTR